MGKVRIDSNKATLLNIIPRAAFSSLGIYHSPHGRIEKVVCALWSQLLSCAEVGVHDDYFIMGGSSLQALEMFENLNNRYRLALPVSALYQESTPHKLAARIEKELSNIPGRGAETAALPVRIAEGPEPVLFLIPGLECEPIAFEGLGRLMRGRRSLYGLQLPGMYSNETPCADIGRMATALIADMRKISATGPYHLLGQCAGGLIAMEMARQLNAAGESVAQIVALDPPWVYIDPRLKMQRSKYGLKHFEWRLHKFWRSLFSQPLRYTFGVYWTNEKEHAYKVMLKRVQYAYRKAVLGYAPQLCSFPVTLIGLPQRGDGRVAKWRDFVGSTADIIEFPGRSSGEILRENNAVKLAALVTLPE